MASSTVLVILLMFTLVTGSSICQLCSCTNGNTTVDCSDRSLEQIPDDVPKETIELILATNHIQAIPDFTFNDTQLKRLDLSKNKIYRFNSESFYGLNTLETLLVSDNKINLENKNYPVGVFRHLKHLKRLDLSSNIRLTMNTSYPDEVFGDLVSLSKLKIDGLPEPVFGAEFSDLKQLTYLSLSGHCKTENILNDTFVNVPHLQILILSKCFIRNIDSFAFTPLESLTYLDLSCNQRLGFDKATKPLKNINTQTLNVLDLSALELLFSVGVVVKNYHAQNIQHLNLSHLFLDHNSIEMLDFDALLLFPKTVKYVSFVDNKPTFGKYQLFFGQLKNVIYFDFSQQYITHTPPNNVDNSLCGSRREFFPDSEIFVFDEPWHESKTTNGSNADISITRYSGCKLDKYVLDNNMNSNNDSKNGSKVSIAAHHDKMKRVLTSNATNSFTKEHNRFFLENEFTLPPNLIFVNGSYSVLENHIPQFHLKPNKVRILDLSSNVLSKWYGPIVGVHHLEWLDLSSNFCDNISDVFFSDCLNLKYLRIASNFLSIVFEKDTKGQIFSSLENLETLDISDNKLRSLPKDIFKNLTGLKALLMSNNPIKIWTINVQHMKQLEYIDASYNLLTTLPVDFMSFCDKQHQKNKTLSVNLLGQNLKCTCDNLDFLKWMKKNTVKFIKRHEYSCTDEHDKVSSLKNLDELISSLETQCSSYTVMVVVTSCVGSLVIVLVLIGVLYKYRFKIRYLLYLRTRAKYLGYAAIEGTDDAFKYDAFISYANDDSGIVSGDMVDKLEKEENLKLCIHDRDFTGGEIIANNIIEAISTSRKTVILLSSHFLASEWCMYELNMAYTENVHTGRNSLIVIVYEKVPDKKLPRILMETMRNDSYIEYTDDPDGNAMFWDKLLRAIKTE